MSLNHDLTVSFILENINSFLFKLIEPLFILKNVSCNLSEFSFSKKIKINSFF